jgi:type II secretory pathway pseudopilin PulG
MQRLMKWVRSNEAGFTLAELLVVVGIIVGLAAVILPNVGRFTGKGAEGALATEWGSVQTAMDAWASEGNVVQVTAGWSGDLLNVAAVVGAVDLTGFLRLPAGATLTVGLYCWDTDGTVDQDDGTIPLCNGA